MDQQKTPAEKIADALGRSAIARRRGVSPGAVTNALTRTGCFPARWYPQIREMCAEAGLDCPLEAFGFEGAA